jgi:hypothetical protein
MTNDDDADETVVLVLQEDALRLSDVVLESLNLVPIHASATNTGSSSSSSRLTHSSNVHYHHHHHHHHHHKQQP